MRDHHSTVPMFHDEEDDSNAAMIAAGWIIMASFAVVCVALGFFIAWVWGL